MHIDRIDHFVLTVADIDATCDFYESVLGMSVLTFGDGRKALGFGDQKINLHRKGREFEPKAVRPTPGSGDFCLTTTVPLDQVIAHLEAKSVAVELGPVARTGARAELRSVYCRDPDGNLVEISNEA
ncbi:MAG TPA: VOC family protein [Stellaceae bacterium]|jgi:catechol 2,3-dioxygenase-like lactoylglutathione lyase family enzyme|nr:VOC family protein [Stellaceae bacterium]